jgi:glycosyltransferase involved in cell wall biosynthesis
MNEPYSRPLVSVAVPVYNQGTYIAKALDSILLQKTDFDIEIVIGDDYSYDNTREILEVFKLKYPDKIKLILAKKNQGVFQNAFDIYKNCLGKYIAILEGDDLWTYENKLQKQFEFLENNPEYMGCFHDAEIVSARPTNQLLKIANGHNYSEYKYYSQFNHYKSDIFPWDILNRNIIPTASLVFRNADFSEFFTAFAKIELSLQWALHLFIIQNSKFKYFNETWSVYNDHNAGLTKTKKVIEFNLSNIAILKKYLQNNYYRTMKLDLTRAILKEFRQILYGKQINEKSFGFFVKNLLAFSFYTIILFIKESVYFFALRLGKK